jgi:hypothetical protein
MKKVICLFCFVCFLFFSCKEDHNNWQIPSNLVFQTGDIVFREGKSVESEIVKGIDKKSIYSHVGLVIWFDSAWRVVHAVPNESNKNEKDKIKVELIEEFFATDKALSGGIYRADLQQEDTILIYSKVKEIIYRSPLFDVSMDLQDTTSFYCTELVWHIFRTSLNIDLSQGRRHNLPLFSDLIFCSDIISYSNLKLVYQF